LDALKNIFIEKGVGIKLSLYRSKKTIFKENSNNIGKALSTQPKIADYWH
jgi:hypothetical protein